MKPFFDHYLKGAPDPHTPTGADLRDGHQPAGRKARAGRWARRRRFIWRHGIGASFDRPAAAGHDDYVSDPAKPVPYLPRPISTGDRTSGSRGWFTTSASSPTAPTCSVYTTRAADQSRCTSWARPQVDLFAATSGTDSDWVVKLIDVYPNETPEERLAGVQAETCPASSCRSASRSSAAATSTASPSRARCAPGKVEQYRFGLPNVEPRVPAGAQDHGAGPVEPVPGLRPQSADVRAEHLLCARPATTGRRRRASIAAARTASAVYAAGRALAAATFLLDLALDMLGRRLVDRAVARFDDANRGRT